MKKNSHLRDFARYASLNVLGMIGVSCYILADTFFVAKGMGADGVTALNIAIQPYPRHRTYDRHGRSDKVCNIQKSGT